MLDLKLLWVGVREEPDDRLTMLAHEDRGVALAHALSGASGDEPVVLRLLCAMSPDGRAVPLCRVAGEAFHVGAVVPVPEGL